MIFLISLLTLVTCFYLPLKKPNNSVRSLSSISMPVEGNYENLQYYYVDVKIGSEQVVQNLILDTGSSLTGVPCEDLCLTCGKHSAQKYNFSKSHSSSYISCIEAGCFSKPNFSCNSKNQCEYNKVSI